VTTADITGWLPAADRVQDRAPFVVDSNVLIDIFKTSTAWILLPAEPADPVSPLPRIFQEIRELTGWAQRDLADVLGTSHTTIGRLGTLGRVTARSRATATRAAELHAVLVRLARVAAGPESLVVALSKEQDDTTALDLLRDGQWSRAYTAALDAIRGPRPAMLGAAQAPVRAATRELRP
jgi:transcriptional regulator with XRE-family HTH domain